MIFHSLFTRTLFILILLLFPNSRFNLSFEVIMHNHSIFLSRYNTRHINHLCHRTSFSHCHFCLSTYALNNFPSVAAECETSIWFEPVSVIKSKRVASIAKLVSDEKAFCLYVIKRNTTDSNFFYRSLIPHPMKMSL